MAIKSFLVAALSTIAVASPIALEARNGRDSSNTTTSSWGGVLTILPSTISIWNSGSSTVQYNTEFGLVQRYSPSLNQFATLMTYSIPSQYAGNTCELVFTLTQPSSYATGTQGAQVFFDQQGARPGATSDYRDSQIATFTATNGGYAIWGTVDNTSTGKSSWEIPCSTLINRPYLDVAPMGDNDSIYWRQGDGLKIRVLGA